MRTRNCSFAAMAVALVLALTMVPSAIAQCGLSSKLVKPTSWQPQVGAAHLVRAGMFDDDDEGASIVGMWHVKFTALTQDNQPLPSPGFTFDNSLVTWHADGTELMNSSRPAQDGNFCMGVWKKTGQRTYLLNHIPWQGNDPSNAPSGIGNPAGGAQFMEQITLSQDGNSYTGSFTFTAYDTAGNPEVTFTGSIAATRVTVHTPFSSLL